MLPCNARLCMKCKTFRTLSTSLINDVTCILVLSSFNRSLKLHNERNITLHEAGDEIKKNKTKTSLAKIKCIHELCGLREANFECIFYFFQSWATNSKLSPDPDLYEKLLKKLMVVHRIRIHGINPLKAMRGSYMRLSGFPVCIRSVSLSRHSHWRDYWIKKAHKHTIKYSKIMSPKQSRAVSIWMNTCKYGFFSWLQEQYSRILYEWDKKKARMFLTIKGGSHRANGRACMK